ncbi:MAG: hypothetical protein WEK74_06430 [Hydrogenophaga sp.]
MEAMHQRYGLTAKAGDGINDAATLARPVPQSLPRPPRKTPAVAERFSGGERA